MDGRILILEDDRSFADMLVQNLEANSFSAEVSLDPSEALERVQGGGYDLLVSDYLMPKLEGTAFIRQVRGFDGQVPVIMISAYMGEPEMKQAAEAGVTRVLKKPFEIPDLIAEIRQLVGEDGPVARRNGGGPKGAGEVPGFSLETRFLPPVASDSREWIRRLREAFDSGQPVFLSGENGMEVDPIAAEIAVWSDPDGGVVSFDFQAADLLSPATRSLLARFAGKDRYSRVAVVRDLDRLDRSQQRVLHEALEGPDGFLGREEPISFLFAIEAEHLAVAEMAMDESLLGMVFGNLVRVPPLRGRYRDIAEYLSRPLEDGTRQSFDAGAVAFLLRYDWPGNHGQLLEMRRRLARTLPDAVLGREDVRAALEKRLTEPLEESGDPSLAAVLRDRQREILESVSHAERSSPAKVLERVGCPGAEPAADFPAGQELLCPELLDSAATN